MQIDVLTLFPGTFAGYFDQTPLRDAIRNNLLRVRVHNFCQWADRQHPIMNPGATRHGEDTVINGVPVAACVESVLRPVFRTHVVLLSPQGRSFSQSVASELSHVEQLVLICGRLGGFEDGLVDRLGADQISVGNCMLNCGEVAAMVVMDAVIRLVPGVIEGQEKPVPVRK